MFLIAENQCCSTSCCIRL